MNLHPRKYRLLLLIFVIIQFSPTAPGQRRDDRKPTLLLVSIDGFRADYLTKYSHPMLDALAREGVRARWMTPSYPSLTFPNHYAIATGLYPEHNGIVANDIYDPEFAARFAMSKREEVENGRWWGGEPIWVTAEKQGQKASATFWPGSQAEIRGIRPSYWKTYDDKVPASDRVDALLTLLDLPLDQRPTFLTLYFSDVDHAGHDHSPNSAEVGKAIVVVDSALKRLVNGLQARGLYQHVNIIVVSDHGMAPVPPNQTVILDDYFDASRAQQIVWGTELTNIFAKPGDEAELVSSLKQKQLRHARCYGKTSIPERFHYNDNKRIGTIVCMAEEGWRMVSRARYEEDQKLTDHATNVRGAHGYDNQLLSMRAIFVARGPAFKRGITIGPFPNVDVYDIMVRVLRLNATKNDGNPETARAVLRE